MSSMHTCDTSATVAYSGLAAATCMATVFAAALMASLAFCDDGSPPVDCRPTMVASDPRPGPMLLCR